MLSLFNFFKKNKKKSKNFFDLSKKERFKIIKEAAREANEEQLELIKRYDKIYGKSTVK